MRWRFSRIIFGPPAYWLRSVCRSLIKDAVCVDRLLVTVIRALLSRLVAATDNNVQGDKYADRLRWRSFERLRSKDVDWKDELRGRVRPLMRIIRGIRE